MEAWSTLGAILAEPPFRRIVKALLRNTPGNWRAKARYDAVARPQYLAGCFYAADQACREGKNAVAVIEFGVAEGYGLVELQKCAAIVERETGIIVAVYGFDSGGGLPDAIGDYRDHPDVWAPGDYVMDVAVLRGKLTDRTTLVLGQIRQTVNSQAIDEPIGFVAIDVDFYSSTMDALRVLERNKLRRVAMYFDDITDHYNHRAAGELLAIDEFNEQHKGVAIIDRWLGLRHSRVFSSAYLDAMFIAHDLTAISKVRLTRKQPARMR